MSLERLKAHYEEVDGCWIWQGCLDKAKSPFPSPVIHVSKPKRKLVSVRRWAYEVHNQVSLPSDHVVSSICKNSLCVNPAHLAAIKRGKQGSRLIGDWKSEHCQRGHEFSVWNTGLQKSGTRFCIACDKNHAKTYMSKRRQEMPEHEKALRDARIQELYKWVDTFKITCKLCNESDPVVLDFHHRDPKTKIGTISNAIRGQWSKERIKTEIDKCDLFCVRCHRKHHSEQDWANRREANI